ncbi:uncharacterized protein TNCV_2200701 [Trichonephila clavipes]|nr:uncharacterized protein TNCV_2200701 [Trichonephila clavipes]
MTESQRNAHPKPASSQQGLVRGTVFLLENSITLQKTEQHKQMEVINQQLYIPNCIEGVLYTPVSVLSYPGKTYNPIACIEQWYSRRSMAPETHTVKQTLHCLFTDCITGTVIQMGGNLS